MNEFGQIADDLTTLEMRVEQMLGRQHAKALKAALQRAFVEACRASRAQRLEDDEAQASEGSRGGSGQGSNSSVRRAPSRKKQSLEMRSAEVGA